MRTSIYFLQGELGHTIATLGGIFIALAFFWRLIVANERRHEPERQFPRAAEVNLDSAWAASVAREKALIDSLTLEADSVQAAINSLTRPSTSR